MQRHYYVDFLFSFLSVSVFPEIIVTTPDDAVTYLCLSPTNPFTGIQWLLNNTLLEDLNLTDVTTAFAGVAGSLTFSNPSDYNVTSVTCRALLQSGEEGRATALLLVQGIIIWKHALTVILCLLVCTSCRIIYELNTIAPCLVFSRAHFIDIFV